MIESKTSMAMFCGVIWVLSIISSSLGSVSIAKLKRNNDSTKFPFTTLAVFIEIALVNQKGFVSYYFLDGDPDWLRQLGEYRQIFKERLNEARSFVESDSQKEAINLIDSEYVRYVALKDQVISHYREGQREAGALLHREVRNLFFKILDL